jgi:hypothetical protein
MQETSAVAREKGGFPIRSGTKKKDVDETPLFWAGKYDPAKILPTAAWLAFASLLSAMLRIRIWHMANAVEYRAFDAHTVAVGAGLEK